MFLIKSLFIPCVELNVDAYFIMDLFYENCIATVERVTFESYGSNYKRAYVDIYEWHDSEIAYNFIKRLKNETIETKLIHSDDNWWIVKINFKKDTFYLNQNNTFINYLVENNDFELNLNEYKSEDIISNQKGRELLAYLNGVKQKQDYEDWKEIEDMINISLKCFNLEFSY